MFFCPPPSPWERPGGENVNGLIREYLPKGQLLDNVEQAALNKIADRLNTRPRKTLNWRTPDEVYKDTKRWLTVLPLSGYSSADSIDCCTCSLNPPLTSSESRANACST